MSKIIHLTTTGHVASVLYHDANSNTVPVVGVPAWSVAPAGIVNVTPAADGMSAAVDPVALGDCTITVTAEGDEVAGMDTITLTGDVTVAAAEATGGALSIS